MDNIFFQGDYLSPDELSEVLLRSEQVLAIMADHNYDILGHKVRPNELQDIIDMLPEGSYINDRGQAVIGSPKNRTLLDISDYSSKLSIGSSVEITVTTNANDFTVHSLDPNIATVVKSDTKFIIRPVSVGTTKIKVKAKAHDHDTNVKSITINVVNDSHLDSSLVELSSYSSSILATKSLEFTIDTPATNISIESGDKSIATAQAKGSGDQAKIVVVNTTKLGGLVPINITVTEDGKLPITKVYLLNVLKPSLKIHPSNSLVLGTGESTEIKIELINADDYSFTEKRRDVITYDKATSTVTATEVVTDGTDYPLSYIEFIPKLTLDSQVLEGEMVYLAVRTIDNPKTKLILSTETPAIWTNDGYGSTQVSVITSAEEFTCEPEDDKLDVICNGNTAIISAKGQNTTSNITFRAKDRYHREAVKTIPVKVDEPTRITVTPSDPGLILRLGTPKVLQVDANCDFQVMRNNNNLTTQTSSDGRLVTLNPATAGWCNVTLFGTKAGASEYRHFTVCQILNEDPRFNIDNEDIYIQDIGSTATITVDTNLLGNLSSVSTDPKVASIVQSGNTITVTANSRGVAHIRIWTQHQEHNERRVRVVVASPVVLVDNKLTVSWTKASGQSFQHPEVTYAKSASDYDSIVVDTDQLSYDKDSRTITTKGNLTSGQDYVIKLVPKVSGVLRDEATCSYLVVRGQ